MRNLIMPTFSLKDVERINRKGLSRKESILWVVWTVLEPILLVTSIVIVAIILGVGQSFLFGKPELASTLQEVQAYAPRAIFVCTTFYSVFLIPHGIMLVDDISNHERGVISFSVFMEMEPTNSERWEILSDHSVAILDSDPRFGSKYCQVLFFPPWERLFIAAKVYKLQKEAKVRAKSRT